MRVTLVNLCQKISKLTLKQSNLPESYVKRAMERVEWQTPKLPNFSRKVIKKRLFHYDIYRPWTPQFQETNSDDHRKIFLEPIKEWTIFKGDRVQIMVGKDKGKQGIVVDVIEERNWVIVEGLNTYLRLMGKTKKFPGVLIQQEAPLLVTHEVQLVDPTDLMPVKAEMRFTQDGEKVRVSERSGRIIPIPTAVDETYDFKSKALYLEKPQDTPATEVEKVTFAPSLETFEMCIMREMGMKEDREEAPTFWY